MSIMILTMIIVICAAMSGCRVIIIGRDNANVKEKVFTKDGISITLDDSFIEKHHNGSIAYYTNRDLGVFVGRQNIGELKEFGLSNYSSTYDYSQSIIDSQPEYRDEVTFTEYKGITVYQYEIILEYDDGVEIPCKWTAYVFKHDGAFYLFRFATRSMDYEKNKERIEEMVDSITFDE